MSSFERHYAGLKGGEGDPCSRQYPQGTRSISGSASFDSLVGSEIDCSGSVMISGELAAQRLNASGSLRAGRASCCDASVSGSLHVGGPASFGTLYASGSVVVEDELECSVCKCSGRLDAKDIRAESTEISGFVRSERVDCTRFIIEGGGNVSRIKAIEVKINRRSHGIFSLFRKGEFNFQTLIASERAEVSMARGHVIAAKDVRLGKGCKVDEVYYVESYEVEDGASVGSTKKVSSLEGIERWRTPLKLRS
ncbi:hypothetical protein PQ610_00395 [Tardisphaera miroshnichenkoae]